MQMRRCWYGNQSLQGRNILCTVCVCVCVSMHVYVCLRGWQLAVRKVRANQALTLMHTALWPLCHLSVSHALALSFSFLVSLYSPRCYFSPFHPFSHSFSLHFTGCLSWWITLHTNSNLRTIVFTRLVTIGLYTHLSLPSHLILYVKRPFIYTLW